METTGQLGQIVSWQVPATVPLSDLRGALSLAGLDPSLAGDMELRNALRRGGRTQRRSVSGLKRFLEVSGKRLESEISRTQNSKPY